MANLKDMAKNAVGLTEKATIQIIDKRKTQVKEQKAPQPQGGGALGGMSRFTEMVDTDVLDKASSLLEGQTGVGLAGSGATLKCFEVQFNPNELRLSGYGGGLVQKVSPAKADDPKPGGISFEKMDVRLSLRVKLIFDHVERHDAFMYNDGIDNPLELANTAARSVMRNKAAGKGKTNSVRPEVEGLIAALRNKYTRMVIFSWGQMSYTGVLSNLQSQYTMFNTIGEPIRAEVNLEIVLVDEAVSKDGMGAWAKHFEDAFGSGDLLLTTAGQKVGNLLNIGV